MNLRTRPLLALAISGLMVSGCSAPAVLADPTTSARTVVAAPAASTAATTNDDGDTAGTSLEAALGANLTAHDTDETWDDAEEAMVTLADGASTTDSAAVAIDGDTITITAAGTYRLSGTLTDGQVVVRAGDDDAVRIVLDDASLTSSTSAALWVDTAGQVAVDLADGTDNALTDTARTMIEGSEEPDAALYSSVDLTLTGTGNLTVTGAVNDAIMSTDGLVVDGASIAVTAVDDGIRGKDYLVVRDGSLQVTAGGDGLKSDRDDDPTAGYVAILGGSVTVDADGDGISAQTDVLLGAADVQTVAGSGSGSTVADDASAKGVKAGALVSVDGAALEVDAAEDALHSDAALAVHEGTLLLAAGDDGIHAETEALVVGGTLTVRSSHEALEGSQIRIAGGELSLTSTDDGINAAGGTGAYDVAITGGSTVIDAGGDGLDSNGTVTMSGGSVVVAGPVETMNGSIDVDGSFIISGGELLAVGTSAMAMAPSTDSSQTSVLITLDGWYPAGSTVQVLDSTGTAVHSFEATKNFSSVVYSGARLVAGEAYTVVVDGAEAGTGTGGEYATAGMFGGPGGGGGQGGNGEPAGPRP